jgi:5-methylcytosine-specific restriction endonuclease McrA
VKRAVRERDGERCAFVSASGQRCSARSRLEFDHIEPVARGGASTVENVRLVCRSHNQHAAESAFGIEFMERKRAEARRVRFTGSAILSARI